MNFERWEPVYEAILADFGFGREADERARDLLDGLVEGGGTADPDELPGHGRTVAIAGGAPGLDGDLELARSAEVVFAASTAAARLRNAGVGVDCMVTDLDKNPGTVRTLTDEGIPVVAHAHGDNIRTVRELIPEVTTSALVPTTQAAPTDRVHNFGGFTDGDRAAFLADHLGAERLVFPGWAFDDPGVDTQKARKLQWAERLLYWLEERRGERFDPLAGRRGDIDTASLPL